MREMKMSDPLSPITRVAAAFVILFVVAPALSNPHFSQAVAAHLPLIVFIAFVWVARRPLLAVIRWFGEGLFIGIGARASGVVGRLSRRPRRRRYNSVSGSRRNHEPSSGPRGPERDDASPEFIKHQAKPIDTLQYGEQAGRFEAEPGVAARYAERPVSRGNMQIDNNGPDAISAIHNLGFKSTAAKKMVSAAQAQLGPGAEFNDIVIFALKMGRVR